MCTFNTMGNELYQAKLFTAGDVRNSRARWVASAVGAVPAPSSTEGSLSGSLICGPSK
jgi:hypothetical protein